MGIIGTIVVYIVLGFCNTISSGMLIDTKKYCETHVCCIPTLLCSPRSTLPSASTVTTPASFQLLGPTGLTCFLVIYLFAIWGVEIATAVVVFLASPADFRCGLRLQAAVARDVPQS